MNTGMRKKQTIQYFRIAVLLLMLSIGTAGLRNIQIKAAANVKNILLIGSDHRDESWNGNSDVMIVATINHDTKQIILTSFMRDLYADIPGYGVHKLNYAYAVGGADTLKATLENNYGLHIDNCIMVDFDSTAGVIDALGGVELTVSDDEANMINGYLLSMEITGSDLPCGGTYVLNGYQAVAHMRDRFVGDNDYERTQRQRDVLSGIFHDIKSINAEEIANLAKELLTHVDHDFSPIDILELIAVIPEMTGYELVENRIPYDGMFYSENEMLVPDFEATRAKLHEILGDLTE